MRKPFSGYLPVLPILLFCALPATSTTLLIQSLEGFVHDSGSATAREALTTSSPGFTNNLDGSNLGAFSFAWTNTTGGALSDFRFTLFLDADIDRDLNTFFNEQGEFVSSALPVLAPVGAIAFASWEIDEPEYVFGNIYTHVWEGALDETNGVPSSAPDDVSLALQIQVPALASGQTITVHGFLSESDAAGLAQFDPDSLAGFYFNAYAVLSAVDPGDEDPPTGVPEPASALLVAAGLAAAVLRRLR